MNLKIKAVLFFAFAFLYRVEAQQIVKKDTINGTELNVLMDSRVDDLLIDLEDKCSRNFVNIGENNGSENEKSPTAPKVVVPLKPLTNTDVCRQNPRILGYKIQLVVVKSNEEANEIKAYFRRRFPNLKAETDASLRPNYKVLVGSYFTKESAKKDLASIKSYFKSAIPIQYRIFCVEAK